ncbi:MAG TPA: hypothetical protein VGB70_01005 [Allosphingosinicella sp.]|jgi:hypothetical protein
MFEDLLERGRRRGETRAREVARRLAEAAAGEASAGVRVEAAAEGVRLSGRNLARRVLNEPAIRWLIERVR